MRERSSDDFIVRVVLVSTILASFVPVSRCSEPRFTDTVPDVILAGQSGAHHLFGGFVACGGDVNGDGYDDFAVTASRFKDCRGRAYLYFGGKDRVYKNADHIFDGEGPGDVFGEYIILADLNNDTYADVIVGAVGYNDWQGRVYVYFGGRDMDEHADMVFDGESGTFSWFGRVIDDADINNDGYIDLVINAIGFNEGRSRAYLYYGGDPMDTVADKIFDGENPGDAFGREMDMGPDVNGDGYGDIIFGCRSWNAERGFGEGQGRAYLYYGGPKEIMDTVCDKVFTGENVGDQFGSSVCLFDIDRDDYAEVMIGARTYKGGGRMFLSWGGRMYLYWGGKDMDIEPDLIFNGERGGNLGGDNIDCGYLNDDKYGDILVGAWGGEGKVYLYHGGSRDSMDTICDHAFTGEGGMFGWNTALGDINGDHLDDLVVSACCYKNTGRAYVYYTKPFPSASDQMIPQLIQEGSSEAKPPGFLHEDAVKGDIGWVKNLISTGANVNALDSNLTTPLHRAVIAGHKDVVEILLSHGASIDALDNMACVPLHRAAEYGHKDIAMLLIEREADITRVDILSASALHYASRQGHREVAELLIARSANINTKDAYGDAPLHSAVRAGHKDIVELLITNGAGVNAKNKEGFTPLHLVAMRPRPSRSWLGALFSGDGSDKKMAELLIAKGAAVNAKDNDGHTPLWHARTKGNKEVAQVLSQHQAKHLHDVAVISVVIYPSSLDPMHSDLFSFIPTQRRNSIIRDRFIPIFVSVNNLGDYQETFEVKLTDQTDSKEIGIQTVTVSRPGLPREMDEVVDKIITGEQSPHPYHFGQFSDSGDVNGDGCIDLLVANHLWGPEGELIGCVYLFEGGKDMDIHPDRIFFGRDPGSIFGLDCSLGDVNNDGFADVIIGAAYLQSPLHKYPHQRGRVYLFFGGKNMDTLPDRVFEAESIGKHNFGVKVDVGDVDNDGYGDILVAAENYEGSSEYVGKGRVYLFKGGREMDLIPDCIFDGENAGDRFGSALNFGDVNGDGFADVIIGASLYNSRQGRVYIYYGGKDMDAVADIELSGEATGSRFGLNTIGVGDVDDDGYDDIIVGAYEFNEERGRAYLYFGGKQMDQICDGVFDGENPEDMFGFGISCGHINHDRYADIVIGARHYDNQRGRVYVFYGAPRGSMDSMFDTKLDPLYDNYWANGFGKTKVLCVDINADGSDDVIVPAPWWGHPDRGRVYIFHGASSDADVDMAFRWPVANASIGRHTLKVEIPPVPGEQNIKDNVKTVTIEVREPSL
jgi:ankyrin repeat protein